MSNAAKGLTLMRRGLLGLHARPWVRAMVLLWLFAGILLVSFHQHHGNAAGHDCALCTAGQSPVTVSPAAIQLTAPRPAGAVHVLAPERGPTADFLSAFPSRAPPRS